MKKKLFDELVQSIKEAGQIRKGLAKPSRAFRYRPARVRFPLPAFEQMIAAEDETAKAKLRRQFQTDVTKHIDKIACEWKVNQMAEQEPNLVPFGREGKS